VTEAKGDQPDPLARLALAVAELRETCPPVSVGGTIVLAASTHFKVAGLSRLVRLGDMVEIQRATRRQLAQVIRVEPDTISIKPFDNDLSIKLGTRVVRRGPMSIRPSEFWKGRVLDALARPIDGQGSLPAVGDATTTRPGPPPALTRQRLGAAVPTGVRVVDIFTPICLGQRMGIFAGSGVGKSTLLGMLARSGGFDTSVIALVGERSREVREFMEDILGETARQCVVVVATGDESPMMRQQAPRTALSIAESYRDRGEHVLLIVDSVTRYAHAVREVSLAAGEPPVVRGYTPSVLSELPNLLERAGPGIASTGSITGIFSVLVDGDDHNDPISDAVRGILDGHIVLDRAIAARGQYPAVDLLSSVSRMADKIWSDENRVLVRRLKADVAEFEQTRDVRLLGAYRSGTNLELDRSMATVPKLYEFLTQRRPDRPPRAFEALSAAMAAWT
jgi:flagellum-specific ATP synthase